MNQKGLLTIILLVGSNIFMTLAWYGHLKIKQLDWARNLNWPALIALSWGIALFEYCLQVPANRIGYQGTGGPFSLLQLKVVQEVITLVIFIVFSRLLFKNEGLEWNHYAAFGCLVAAVYLVFK